MTSRLEGWDKILRGTRGWVVVWAARGGWIVTRDGAEITRCATYAEACHYVDEEILRERAGERKVRP